MMVPMGLDTMLLLALLHLLGHQRNKWHIKHSMMLMIQQILLGFTSLVFQASTKPQDPDLPTYFEVMMNDDHEHFCQAMKMKSKS